MNPSIYVLFLASVATISSTTRNLDGSNSPFFLEKTPYKKNVDINPALKGLEEGTRSLSQINRAANKQVNDRAKAWGPQWYEDLDKHRKDIIKQCQDWENYFTIKEVWSKCGKRKFYANNQPLDEEDIRKRRKEQRNVFSIDMRFEEALRARYNAVSNLFLITETTNFNATFMALVVFKNCVQTFKKLFEWRVQRKFKLIDIELDYDVKMNKISQCRDIDLKEMAEEVLMVHKLHADEMRQIYTKEACDLEKDILICQNLESTFREKMTQMRVWLIVGLTPLAKDIALMISEMLAFDFDLSLDRM